VIRKLLLVAAAIAMPASAGAVTLVATAPSAGAAATINCHIAGTVTFASPGLSHNGKVTTATTSTTSVSGETYSKGTTACTGTSPTLSIKTANTKCNASGATTTIPACVGHPTEYGYGSFDSYAKTGVSSIKADVKTYKFTVNKVAYTSTTCTTSSCVAIHTCPTSKVYGSESGFEIKGKITAPATSPYKNAATTVIVCLGSAVGSHLQISKSPKATKPGFVYNLTTGLGTSAPDKAIIVTKGLFDPTESSLNIA
jgi:hypothetical protein